MSKQAEPKRRQGRRCSGWPRRIKLSSKDKLEPRNGHRKQRIDATEGTRREPLEEGIGMATEPEELVGTARWMHTPTTDKLQRLQGPKIVMQVETFDESNANMPGIARVVARTRGGANGF